MTSKDAVKQKRKSQQSRGRSGQADGVAASGKTDEALSLSSDRQTNGGAETDNIDNRMAVDDAEPSASTAAEPKEMTSADYYFDSYAHFGESTLPVTLRADMTV